MSRYYPSLTEEKLLIQDMKSYFRYPEKSISRNNVAYQTSIKLLKIFPHWSHRNVRLWFNNNKSLLTNSHEELDHLPQKKFKQLINELELETENQKPTCSYPSSLRL